MHYRFELFTPENSYDAAAFVRRHEYCCVNLAEQLRLCICPEYTVRYKKAALLYECAPQQKRCCGVLLFTRFGMLLHCFAPGLPQDVISAFGTFFLTHDFAFQDLHAVSGTAAETRLLEHLIHTITGKAGTAAFDYHLMSLMQPCGTGFTELLRENTGAAVDIARAEERDAEALFPLQLEYEREEVAYGGQKINPAACRLSLQRRIRQTYIYVLRINGNTTAKAEINGQGFYWFQLGGIYTLPEYRNKGAGAAVLAHLINTHRHSVHGFSLFVKTGNDTAIRLYTKLGFTYCGSFRMSYR